MRDCYGQRWERHPSQDLPHPQPSKLAQPHNSPHELLYANLSAWKIYEMILLHSKSGLEKRELYIRAVNREKGNRDKLLSTGMAYAAQNNLDY
jgi:hypothetical protein